MSSFVQFLFETCYILAHVQTLHYLLLHNLSIFGRSSSNIHILPTNEGVASFKKVQTIFFFADEQ